ncbi:MULTISPECIES: DUF5052 family protein [unclassified Fusibacter]|uniref:DUF5052 family protein n=1 Tax=unclassified Fusibacter TaxID=2624464 RepID=UPI00101019A6|nr:MULTISPECIES: DUF5052 family protein [unclassified Fusibacter]MCK8059668.1 DUF5052 family protein [Fusibacter sp. A2]NPE21469.1 DUF5052 family protein [Fusibacter sp. A1]RXV61880.1 DUF5052 family protein [Fusibacter sp. A1]
MKKKIIFITTLLLMLTLSGCTSLKSQFKDLSAEWVGLERTFTVFNDYGDITMSVTGTNTDMQPSEVENVLMIEVDGSRWQHVGSTMIAFETGLVNHIDAYKDALDLSGDNSGTITSIDKALNQFFSNTSGLARVVIIKTQTGMPIAVYEGDKVLVEASALPNTTKILIDNKRLHVYRADLEIIEKSLFD